MVAEQVTVPSPPNGTTVTNRANGTHHHPEMDSSAEEIVISGISGRFPESKDMNEFMENLLAGVNMVTVNERRFKPGLYGIPEAFGTLPEIDRFDADAFGMLPPQVRRTDPQLRLTLECVYEAMCDAGINPADERGSRTGVFLGLCTSEAQSLWSQNLNRTDGLALVGCTASMFANRVSYAYDFKGPSAAYDTACSTSAFALEAAVAAIRGGRCDAAIVTASTLILTPTVNVQFSKLGMLAKDGACKSFDKSGDGFARAEAVATIYLQRASFAKRAYATIVHVRTNTDGYKDAGITYPSSMMQEELLRSVYRETSAGGKMRFRKEEVTYVEAHGTGTAAGDPQEVAAIAHIFRSAGTAEGSPSPLLIGSVKSNMGHAEGASGLCSIAKIVVMLQSGIIPANLHFKEPAYGLNALRNGRLRVVDNNTPWRGGAVAVNSFGFGGVNVHFVLRPYVEMDGHVRRRSSARTHLNGGSSAVPRLVLFSGRNEAGVADALRKISGAENDSLFALANELNRNSNPMTTVRGFTVHNSAASPAPAIPPPSQPSETDSASPPLQDVLQTAAAAGTPPSLWLVFNGIGSHWLGMGQGLLQLPVFAASIEASARVLKSRFVFDLLNLLNSTSSETFENPTNCFVGITAVQIGLVDVLNAVGLRPAGFLGHSAGEMACAYLDGCLTAEETIVCAYLRGESLRGCEEGAMAVVSMTWPQIEKLCPSGVYPACHNGLDSVTISGAPAPLADFVQELRDKKKGVTPVKSCGVAFHSPYIAKASIKFLQTLRAAFSGRANHARSGRWISTSIPEAEWASSLAATASPEYFVNNFLSPVLFYEALQHVPPGALVLEVGPSGLLRGLVKKACPTATVVPLQARDKDPKQSVVDLLTALGKVYLAGINIDANKLVHADGGAPLFPVPLGTPFISPLVAGAWDHSTSWEVPAFGMNGELQHTSFEIDMSTEAHAFLSGHVVQGRTLFPATGYLFLVWRHFAQTRQLHLHQCPVVFENIRFNRVTVLGPKAKVEFKVHIAEVSGSFEVMEGGAVVASGKVRAPDRDPSVVETRMDDTQFEALERDEGHKLRNSAADAATHLDTAHIYKRFRFYGFEYGGLFRGIQRADAAARSFSIAWHGNWIAFLDTFFQTCIVPFERSDRVKLPTAITKLVLNPGQFLQSVAEESTVFVYKNVELGLLKCRGIELHWPRLTTVNRRLKERPPILSSVRFSPYFDQATDPPGADPTLECVSIIMPNISSNRGGSEPALTLTVVELTTSEAEIEHLAAESKAVHDFMWLNFGIMDVSYTVYAQSCSDELRAQFAAQCSGIVLKGFETFQKESWFDKTYDVIILHNHIFLILACEYLKKGSFLILKTVRGTLSREALQEKLGPKFRLVAVKSSEAHTVFLIRKHTKQPATEAPIVINVSSRNLDWVPRLQAAVREQEAICTAQSQEKPPRVFLVSNGAQEVDSGIYGLLNCIRKEPHSQQIRMIFSKSESPLHLDFENPSSVLAAILDHDLVVNVLDESGRWGFYSGCKQLNYARATRPVESAFVAMASVGDLTTFRWIEGHDFKALEMEEMVAPQFVPIEVHFAALNFKDIMLATGNLPAPDPSPVTPYHIESPLGLEFAGVTMENGSSARVCGYIEAQALATQVLGFRNQLWQIPATWTFSQAATVPVVYATAYMALVLRGDLQEGESVLIHSGAGGVGQAAIRIALSKGATVFTTVGSPDKREFLRTEFPQIPESHVGNSRDTSFESMVMTLTQGRGVDLVLNSLAGDKLDASIRCLARHGRFLEIGKFDLVANRALGMELFLKDASFHGVMLDSLYDANPRLLARLKETVQEGIDSGVVQPLPSRVFQVEQIEPAFRYMGSGKHIGKILIQVRKEDAGLEPLLMDAHPRVYFKPTSSYIVIGGLGGIGLEFVNWMITRNARRIVITSRSGVTSAYQSEYIKTWREKAGAQVKVVTLDASEMGAATELVNEAFSLGPLDGFFNLAMHLELAFMRDQTPASFTAAMNPKAVLTRNMDPLTRRLAPSMSHFVVFSSIVAGVGMPGQCNYGMANCAIEQICEKRAKEGLAGKAVELGPISEVGFFHEMHRSIDSTQQLSSYGGAGIQSIGSVLRAMDVLLTVPEPVVVSRVDREFSTAGVGKGEGASALTVVERISGILGTDVAKLNPKTKLTELGLDSIMSMELKQVLEQDYGILLSATEIRTVTVEQLLEMGKKNANTELTPGRALRAGAGGGRRAATADLFQFDFMRNAKKTKILYKQCVHPLNRVARDTRGGDGPIFVCNSVEGPHILRILGTLLKRPAYTMQFPQDAPLHDLEPLTNYYLRELRTVEPHGPYTIAGYSAGIFIAIELALRLQDTGEVSKLVLIDLTPGRADAIFEENFGAERDCIDETNVMVAVLSQVLNIDRTHLEVVVGSLPDRESRIRKAVEIGSAFFDEKVEAKVFERLLSDNPMQLINLFNHYRPSRKYEGKVSLIKTTQNLISYDSTQFWGLEEFCTQTPLIHTVESTHSYLVAEPGVHHVAAALNND